MSTGGSDDESTGTAAKISANNDAQDRAQSVSAVRERAGVQMDRQSKRETSNRR